MNCNNEPVVSETFPLPVGSYQTYAGDLWSQEYIIADRDTDEAFNLPERGWTDWRAYWGDVPLEVDVSDASDGVIRLIADATATRRGKTADFDLQADHPEKGPRTWIRGTLRNRQDVTK